PQLGAAGDLGDAGHRFVPFWWAQPTHRLELRPCMRSRSRGSERSRARPRRASKQTYSVSSVPPDAPQLMPRAERVSSACANAKMIGCSVAPVTVCVTRNRPALVIDTSVQPVDWCEALA